MRRRLSSATVGLGMIAALSCGESVEPPKQVEQPGELTVRLSTPNPGSDSGIVFVISGPAHVSGTAASGMRLFQRVIDSSSTRFALIGPLNAGATLLTFAVPDVHRASAYRAAIEAVTQSDGQLRVLPGEYVLTVLP